MFTCHKTETNIMSVYENAHRNLKNYLRCQRVFEAIAPISQYSFVNQYFDAFSHTCTDANASYINGWINHIATQLSCGNPKWSDVNSCFYNLIVSRNALAVAFINSFTQLTQ